MEVLSVLCGGRAFSDASLASYRPLAVRSAAKHQYITVTMRIKAFTYFVEKIATDYELKDSTVVIDATNYFYNLYEKSSLPFAFGCESNRFAVFLKENLIKFKKANLKCFFVFSVGCEDMQKKYVKNQFEEEETRTKATNQFALPIHAIDVYAEVLDEMKFDYVFFPKTSKDYCITLAKTFGCPIISQDIEFAMSNVSYIPFNTMVLNEPEKSIKCLKFDWDSMLERCALTKNKFSLFIVLTNTDCYPENYFSLLFQKINIPCNPYSRIVSLLKWLSGLTEKRAFRIVYDYFNKDDLNKFILILQNTTQYLNRKQDGLPSDMFLYGDCAVIQNKDPMWFEKGVVNKFIANQYFYLYYNNLYIYNKTIHCYKNQNEYRLSTDIIGYAFNLLTNNKKQQFALIKNTGELITIVNTRMVALPKPAFTADECVFENGWEGIRNLGLFEHFLCETIKGIELKYLEEIPEDARLLMITLTYFTVKFPNETLDELYSILLSYVMLGIVFDDRDDVNIAKAEYELAIDETKNYFKISRTEIECLMDTELYYPLVEFQHCLEEMNYLNALCGFPYKPTIYSKTYNGTFVYKILHTLKTKDLDREDFLVNILKLPPSVYDIFQNLSIIHERLLVSIED